MHVSDGMRLRPGKPRVSIVYADLRSRCLTHCGTERRVASTIGDDGCVVRTRAKGQPWRSPTRIQLPEKGTELFDTSEKVFPDVQAEPGETAYTFMHTVPYEGSVGLVNLLTTTRVLRKGFKTHLVLYGPGVLMASGTRGFPKVGDEAFPGHMAINNQLRTFLDEGGTVYACRFASGALYGFPENLLMEGVKPFHPLDVLDAALTAWRERAFQLNTWTV